MKRHRPSLAVLRAQIVQHARALAYVIDSGGGVDTWDASDIDSDLHDLRVAIEAHDLELELRPRRKRRRGSAGVAF